MYEVCQMAGIALSRALSLPRDFVRRLLLVLVVPAGGCSADVTRFDFPAFPIPESGANRTTGALPTPAAPVWQRGTSYS